MLLYDLLYSYVLLIHLIHLLFLFSVFHLFLLLAFPMLSKKFLCSSASEHSPVSKLALLSTAFVKMERVTSPKRRRIYTRFMASYSRSYVCAYACILHISVPIWDVSASIAKIYLQYCSSAFAAASLRLPSVTTWCVTFPSRAVMSDWLSGRSSCWSRSLTTALSEFTFEQRTSLVLLSGTKLSANNFGPSCI